MIITAGKFGITPMEMELRCAGTVELADRDKLNYMHFEYLVTPARYQKCKSRR